MAKRFTATEKWDDPWFHSLDSNNRLAWIFLLDKCNHAGIWNVNLPLIEFHIGSRPSLTAFSGRVEAVNAEKWFIPKFIEFQYGTLNPENRAHLSVINALKKEGLYKPLTSSLQGAKDKDKEKVKDSLSLERGEPRGEREPLGFAEFWTAYPKKRSRGQALKAWRNLKPSMEQVSRIIAAIIRAKRSTAWAKDGGQFIPYPATWINAQGWEDDMTEASNGHNGPGSIQDRLLAREPKKHETRRMENVPSMQGGLVFPQAMPILK